MHFVIIQSKASFTGGGSAQQSPAAQQEITQLIYAELADDRSIYAH